MLYIPLGDREWGLTAEARAWVEPLLTAHPLKSLEDPADVDPEALASLPRAFVRSTGPTGPYQAFVERARAAGWPCRELSGGDYPMLTVPAALAAALLELAEELAPRVLQREA